MLHYSNLMGEEREEELEGKMFVLQLCKRGGSLFWVLEVLFCCKERDYKKTSRMINENRVLLGENSHSC